MRQVTMVGQSVRQLFENLIKLTSNNKLKWRLEGDIRDSDYSAILGQYKMILPSGGRDFQVCNTRNKSTWFLVDVNHCDNPPEIVVSLFEAIHEQEKRLKKKWFRPMTSQEKQQCLSKLIAFV